MKTGTGFARQSDPLTFNEIKHEIRDGMQKPQDTSGHSTTDLDHEISIDLTEMDDKDFGNF